MIIEKIGRFRAIVIFTLTATFLCSCSALNNFVGEAKPRPPEVDFVGAKLTGLSFDAADLLFDIKIRNPNSVGLKMAGFDYDFLINDNSFLKGDKRDTLRIAAVGDSVVQIPLSLSYVSIYQAFQSLRNQDVSNYQIKVGFSFELPVLGVVNIPVSKSGEFPLLKLPKVKLGALKLKNLSLTGADLLLSVQLENPNAFSMLLKGLQYQFEVGGRDWISGSAEKATQVAEKGQGVIEIPLSLNLLEMGTSVYKLLAGDKELNYQFGGKLDLATSLPLLGAVSLPFDHSGSIKLMK